MGYLRPKHPARTKQLSAERLRDHAREMLEAIITDMASDASAAEQKSRSQGRGPRQESAETSAAEMHAVHRLAEGFTLKRSDRGVSRATRERRTVVDTRDGSARTARTSTS